MVQYLDMFDICVSSGSACAAGSINPSHVLRAIGRSEEDSLSMLRLSLNHENTKEECDYVVEKINQGMKSSRTGDIMLEQISGNAARFMIYALAILSILLIFLAIYYLINIGNRYIDGKKRINIDLRLITKIFLGILIFYLINIIFNKFPILGYTLSSVIIAIIFAYIIDPIVNYLERKGVKRQFGVIIVYISAILIFGILIVSVIPKTINEISNLLTSLLPWWIP
ncbi:Cysteine desulfurase [Peptoniphilus harei]|uniref:Cysteine desulfurase n=2 Tax=Peptoniphilus harei TaxID=54005 RepID=A0A2X1X0Y3_9FIRM|nr:Cysteine desulfurase [Peptoniphilus harei]